MIGNGSRSEYIMSFSAGALLQEETMRVASVYRECHDWQVTKSEVLDSNLLQARSGETTRRLLREISGRLETLTEDQILLLCNGRPDDQKQLLWLAICRRYPFIREFAIEVVRERFLQLGLPVSSEDFDRFYVSKEAWHPHLGEISAQTRKKLKQILFRMLREAGLMSEDGQVVGVFLSGALIRVLAKDDAEDFNVFPVREEDVERWAQQ